MPKPKDYFVLIENPDKDLQDRLQAEQTVRSQALHAEKLIPESAIQLLIAIQMSFALRLRRRRKPIG